MSLLGIEDKKTSFMMLKYMLHLALATVIRHCNVANRRHGCYHYDANSMQCKKIIDYTPRNYAIHTNGLQYLC